MKFLGKIAISFLLLLFVRANYICALEVPEHPRGRVTDYTDTLSPNEISTLNQKLADFEEQTTNQIAVLIIPSLEGDNLEDYSIRLAEKWKIGQKGKDNGVILLIVKNDRKIRIEVGYGLEPLLPDGLAGSIIRDEIAPLFRKAQFFAGINQGVDAIMKATSLAVDATTPKRRGPWTEDILVPLIVLFFIVLNVIGFIKSIKRYVRWRWERSRGITHLGFGAYSSSRGGGGFWGGFSGGGGGFGGGGASGGW